MAEPHKQTMCSITAAGASCTTGSAVADCNWWCNVLCQYLAGLSEGGGGRVGFGFAQAAQLFRRQGLIDLFAFERAETHFRQLPLANFRTLSTWPELRRTCLQSAV